MLTWLLACTGEPSPTPTPPPPVATAPATPLPSPAPPTLGAACDPAADACGPAGRCCTPCCAADATPVCTPPDRGGCPQPDLVVQPDLLLPSVALDIYHAAPDGCGVQLGCVGAPGTREILRFTTSTTNAGTGTFYLGKPEEHPELFKWASCGGRYRADGYEVFRLLDQKGAVVASGKKAGYCLMDAMNVKSGGKPRYTCAEQGITPGWADLYSNGDDCQWVDVTGLPDGDYTLEIEVDPTNRWAESNETNNVTRVPVHLGAK